MTDHLEPTQEVYELTCKIKIVDIATIDLEKQFVRKVCFLVPQESSVRTKFLDAWLPDTSEAHHEIAMLIASPISSYCRGAVMRAHKNCKDHAIYVMSKGIEDDFIKYDMDGRNILLKVLPEGSEADAEEARQADGSYDLY